MPSDTFLMQQPASTDLLTPGLANGEALRQRLANPCREMDLSEALSLWHHVHIRVLCAGAADLALDPRMAARVRGALGRQLALAASAEARAGNLIRKL